MFKLEQMNYNPGLTQTDVFDAELSRFLPVFIFYPTQENTKMEQYGPFEIEIARDGSIAKGEFPVVVISHGSGGAPMAYRTLAMNLATRGYVVCLPEHTKNHRMDNEWEGSLENLQNRPRHLQLVIDMIGSSNQFGDFVKEEETTIIGHSVGGYSALAIAGGIPNTKHIVEFCKQAAQTQNPICIPILKHKIEEQQIDVDKDPRVKNIVLLAATTLDFASEGALKNVDAKVAMFMPENDVAVKESIEVLDRQLPPGQFECEVVQNANHYSFLSPFPEKLLHLVGPAGQDAKNFNREAFHSHLLNKIDKLIQEN